jgi:hypothetical protein
VVLQTKNQAVLVENHPIIAALLLAKSDPQTPVILVKRRKALAPNLANNQIVAFAPIKQAFPKL